MAQQNVFAGGANTTGVGQRGRGGGGNRNRNRNRGGGGGGGGGNKTPKGGLYGGKAGEAAANQNPEVFLQSYLDKAGLSGGASGSNWDRFMSEMAIPDLMRQYNAATADNQRLSMPDWLRQNYGGAGWSGKRGRTFDAGTVGAQYGVNAGIPGQSAAPSGPGAGGGGGGNLGLGGGGGNLGLGGGTPAAAGPSQYDEWYSTENPMAYATSEAMRGGYSATNGNQQFQDWYQQHYIPQQQAAFANQERGQGPGYTFADFLASQPNTSRQQYAYRSPAQRQPTGAPVTGRYSWWQ